MASKQKSTKSQLILGIVLILIGIGLAGWFIWWVVSGLSKELLVTLTTAILTILGAVWVNRNTKLKDRELQIQAQQAEKRELVASNFMKNFWILLKGNFKNERARTEHTEKTIADMMVNGSMWLSDETLKEFVQFRLGAQNGDQVADTSLHIARLMLAFRKDLGHKNKGLTEKDMLDVFINDTDQLFQKPQ